MTEFEYQDACVEYLKKHDFVRVELTPRYVDENVDIIAEKDGERYAIKCFCNSDDINRSSLSNLLTAKKYYRCKIACICCQTSINERIRRIAEDKTIEIKSRFRLNKSGERINDSLGSDLATLLAVAFFIFFVYVILTSG